jgi:hypothetical protein
VFCVFAFNPFQPPIGGDYFCLEFSRVGSRLLVFFLSWICFLVFHRISGWLCKDEKILAAGCLY